MTVDIGWDGHIDSVAQRGNQHRCEIIEEIFQAALGALVSFWAL